MPAGPARGRADPLRSQGRSTSGHEPSAGADTSRCAVGLNRFWNRERSAGDSSDAKCRKARRIGGDGGQGLTSIRASNTSIHAVTIAE